MSKNIKLHFMGIGGSGMKGVAFLAKQFGYKVTGCDLTINGHDSKHLEDIDYLIVSPAVFYQNKRHPELVQALKKKIVMTWQEFLGKELMKDKKVVAIAGTHGKSTTTAMVAKILIDNGFDPSVVIGAYVPEWDGNSRFGKGEFFVVEADEFNNNFLNYHPSIAIINNIEFDHPDYFKDKKQILKSFEMFKKNLINEKILFTAKNSLNKKFRLKVIGEHNQKNANMAYLVGKELGIKDKDIVNSLESFTGIGRRMELIGKVRGVKVFDDYAHHPSAIRTTLAGLRERYPDEKILAVIEPHGYKRTKALLPLYKNCFNTVDSVIVGPIFKARDKIDRTITLEKISSISRHLNIKTVKNIKELLGVCDFSSDTYDIIVVMGAGNSNLWARKILQALRFSKKIEFRNLTTLKVGGKIKYFKEVSSKEDVVEAVIFAKENNLPIFIIGSGSDIAVSDKYFEGLVIKYVGNRCKFVKEVVTVESGMIWDDLVKLTVQKNLQGIECLSGIPGTVGAAPIQNIGAYGQELSDTFVKLTAFDIKKQKFIDFSKKDCKFGYRESVFKLRNFWQKFIITDITLRLNKYTDKDLDLQTIRDEILRVRAEKREDPQKVPNAGSFFKNPIVDKNIKNYLSKDYPDLVVFPFGEKYKISAGWLIEKSGWKGKSLGPVKVSRKHALVLTNPKGKGNFSDIKRLADRITKDVYQKFKIQLEPEVQFINI